MKITALNVALSREFIHNWDDSEDLEFSDSDAFILKFLSGASFFTPTSFFIGHIECVC